VKGEQPSISKPGYWLIGKLCELLTQQSISRVSIRSIERRCRQRFELRGIQILMDNPVIAKSGCQGSAPGPVKNDDQDGSCSPALPQLVKFAQLWPRRRLTGGELGNFNGSFSASEKKCFGAHDRGIRPDKVAGLMGFKEGGHERAVDSVCRGVRSCQR
jgi:hypothetical protein